MKYLFLAFSILCLTGVFSIAEAKVTQEQLESLTTVLDEDVVYYRWQSTQSGENLAKLGKLNAKTNQYFMSMKENVVSGPGIYMALAPDDSSGYLPANGGNLIEIRVPKGTRFIDITDKETIEKMRQMGVDPHEAFTKPKSFENKPLVIKYKDTWLVARDLTGLAEFEMYPGKSVTLQSVREHFESVRYDYRARDQVVSQIVSRRPDLVEQLVKNVDLTDQLTLMVMSDDQRKSSFRNALEKANDEKSVAMIANAFENCSRCRDLIFEDKNLVALAKEKMLKNLSWPNMSSISTIVPSDWVIDYARHHGIDDRRSREVIVRFINKLEKESKSSAEFVDIVRPILREVNALGGNAEWKTGLYESMIKRFNKDRENGVDPSTLKKLVGEFGQPGIQGHQELNSELDEVSRFYSALEALRSDKVTTDQIRSALLQARSLNEFEALLKVMANKHGGQGGNQEPVIKLKELLRAEPELYLRGTDSWTVEKVALSVKKFSDSLGLKQADIYEIYLKKLPADKRSLAIGDIYSGPWKSQLSGRSLIEVQRMIIDNIDELIEGVSDLSEIVAPVLKQSDYEIRKLERNPKEIIFNAVKTPEQLRSVSKLALDGGPEDALKLISKMESMGFHNFSPSNVLSSVQISKLSANMQRKIFENLIDGAVSPSELHFIYYEMKKNTTLAKSDLTIRVVQKMALLKPTQKDIDTLRAMSPRAFGINKLKPTDSFDCIGGWSRALGTKRSH